MVPDSDLFTLLENRLVDADGDLCDRLLAMPCQLFSLLTDFQLDDPFCHLRHQESQQVISATTTAPTPRPTPSQVTQLAQTW